LTVLPWLLVIALVCLCAAFYLQRHRPLAGAQKALLEQLNQQATSLQKLDHELRELDGKQSTLSAREKNLRRQLAATEAEKAAALAELQKAHDILTTSLGDEIAAGEVWIQQRGSDLAVDVADKILFARGEAEVSERGREVLAQVATTLASLDSHIVQVGGHTDSAPITSPQVRERYPTNWELSTARATHVVRFLQDEGNIPGERLVAAGFAQFRPTAPNVSESGRRRNRRIEILLLRRADPPPSAEAPPSKPPR
jgi:chemotaxis protein MotB